MFPSPIPTPAPSPSPAAIAETVEFVIVSPLCLASVSAAAASGKTLHSLLTHEGARENEYDLSDVENLLLFPPTPEADGPEPYGKACTDNTDAVFRKKDVVDFTFTIVEREPDCKSTGGIYPWDHADDGNLCTGHGDTAPQVSNSPIAIQVADAVSGIEKDSDT